ncbi:MAG: DUF177 domain-containing protein [Bacteroidales bacterium]|nr:DUF177 domain-containing protein [Bacteroidales bacterium]
MYFCKLKLAWSVMFEKKDYVIRINGLKNGENDFQILIDRKLFEEFECEEAQDVDIKLSMCVTKTEKMIKIDFSFVGNMQLTCGRCLSLIPFEINKQTNLYIKFGEKREEVDAEQWIVPEGENEIDLLSYIYEELRIEIPISPVHEDEKDCDQEMLNRLKTNNSSDEKGEDEINPIWEKLKELKIKQ